MGRRADASWKALRAEVKAIGLAEPNAERQVRIVPVLEDAGYRTRMGWLIMVGAFLAALAIENGATLATTDRDFARFPKLKLVNPAA